MPKRIKSRKSKIGAAPGSLIHVGDHVDNDVKIELISYNEEKFNKAIYEDIEKCLSSCNSDSINWINIDGLNQVDVISHIGKRFNVHPLILEDILNTTQRPKIDIDNNYIYIVLKMLYYHEDVKEIKWEQISLVIFKNYVLSFQEFEGDVFDDLRKRLEYNKSNIRTKGTDYLAYSLIDAIVDSYFNIVEDIGNSIDRIEDILMMNPSKEILNNIYKLKRELIFLRNSIWPFREVLGKLVKSEYELIEEKTVMYLRDVHDHSIEIVDIIETYRDILSGMLDTYLSSIGNKTNEVMKVLTIFSTIFIPLSFLTGIYGMNFEYMPELKFKYGYLIFWVITILCIVAMIDYFRKKKWF
ncbi:magnesium transporter [Clostridium tetanomorphum]|uniref:Magnesium transport protein CorA n=1 Tax=Clostridium tetanomorphum TaxID=1553 RepID=A0A923J0J4_CLOTT|nr:magnesium/cobalt transporter CorA [Clostridium tetanomorphum]KAJ52556.1 magnesium and cobalt transport protein CorA [Clostridium tetanomorphum DSM 665]MBC2396293.1 magnesium/cobalt transporter CorA [Clostridium tetanomorphum]MBP1863476.1 magnesium transporter [Clostridium tetanomorphum]NRS83574.1 magnesium transporter [Clostridium tetanomorphum]NRZ96775.1 magnesium transporter [Clostridium tetanomorphum]